LISSYLIRANNFRHRTSVMICLTPVATPSCIATM
jgi:hypothetical protein